jgi:chromate reductase
MTDATVKLLDLNDYELPLFSENRENEIGRPPNAQAFFNNIGNSDILVICLAESNGSYTAAYKNLFDWCSRINQKVFQNKPIILLATSPGAGGAKSVLSAANSSASYFSEHPVAAISVPLFYEQFDSMAGVVIDGNLAIALTDATMLALQAAAK